LDAQDELALQTRAQLLLALERFHEVADAATENGGLLLQQSYALYKLGRQKHALELIEGHSEEHRGLKALKAQIVCPFSYALVSAHRQLQL